MPLFCQGHKILTDGELIDLGQRVDYTSSTLTAMAVGGEDVDPNDALQTFDIRIRIAALGDPVVMDLCDRAVDRLIAAFPHLFSAA